MTTLPAAAKPKPKPIINPYLKRKPTAQPTKPVRPPGPVASNNSNSNNKAPSQASTSNAATLPKKKKNVSDVTKQESSGQPPRSTSDPTNKSLAVASSAPKSKSPSSSSTVAPSSSSSTAPALANTKQPTKKSSLKSKLKQEIENIRRATLLEKQQKALRKEQKALEKQRREQERIRAVEEEKRRKQQQQDEERRRKLMEEQEKLQQEKLRLQLERQKKKLQEEEERRRKQKQREEEEQRRFLALQQQAEQVAPWSYIDARGYPAVQPNHGGSYGGYYPQQNPPTSMPMPYPYGNNNLQTTTAYNPYWNQSTTLAAQPQMINSMQQQQAMPTSQTYHPAQAQAQVHQQPMLTSSNQQPDQQQTMYPSSTIPSQQGSSASPALPSPHDNTPMALEGSTLSIQQVKQEESSQVASHNPNQGNDATKVSGMELETPNKASHHDDPVAAQQPSGDEKLAATTAAQQMHSDPTSSTTGVSSSWVTPAAKPKQEAVESVQQQESEAAPTGGTNKQVTLSTESPEAAPSMVEDKSTGGPTHMHTITPYKFQSTVEASEPLESSTAAKPSQAVGSVVSPLDASSSNVAQQGSMTSMENSKSNATGAVEHGEAENANLPLSLSQQLALFNQSHGMHLTASPGQPSPVASSLYGTGMKPAPQPHDVLASNYRHESPAAAYPSSHLQPYGQHIQSPAYAADASTSSWYQPYAGHHSFGGHFYGGVPMSNYPAQTQWQYAAAAYSHLNTNPYLYAGYGQYPSSQAPMRTYTTQPKPRKPRQPKPPAVEILANNPIDSPSPYARTHIVLTQKFVIVKKPGDSFGLNIREDKMSTLVEPEWLQQYQTSTAKKPDSPSLSGEATSSAKKQDLPDAAANCEGKGNQEISSTEGEKNEEKAQKSEPTVSTALPAAVSEKATAPSLDPMDPASGSPPKATAPTMTNQPGGAQELPAPGTEKQTTVENNDTRRKRRKRHFFAIMMVVDGGKQNEKNATIMHLQPGDIILEVNGVPTGGLLFREACTLFTKGCVETKDEKGETVVQASLLIARKKPEPKPLPPISIPSIPATSAMRNIAAQSAMNTAPALKPLEDLDILAFAEILAKAGSDSRRLLGAKIPDSLLLALVGSSPRLVGRDLQSLKGAWFGIASKMEKAMSEAAQQFWNKRWTLEKEKFPATTKNMTDAQRAELRAAPRPVKGCKCGSKDHEYVNDPSCPLYHDVLLLCNRERDSSEPTKATNKVKSTGDLGVVEKGFKESFLKRQAEQKAEEDEAQFVDEMEGLQVQQLKRAIFAPSLTAMVLSAVFELQSAFPAEEEPEQESSSCESNEEAITANGADHNAKDSDDEDDLCLAALAKREAPSSLSPKSKKQKLDNDIKKTFLAKLLLLVSERWGHLYREQEHMDYAWRWEVFHGQTESEGGTWNADATNPRPPGSLPLENIRLLLNDELFSKIQDNSDTSARVALTYLVSTERSGVHDELLALLRMGVLSISGGVPRPSRKWYTRVDLNLLNEMQEAWSPSVDKSGKYCVEHKMRRKLNQKWKASYEGWALRDEPDEVIYHFDEHEEWRHTFEANFEGEEEKMNGIGRFC